MSMVPHPLFVGGIPGGPELLLILVLAIFLFGANKIPELARSSGQALSEFQRGKIEAEEELQEIREGDGEGEDAATEAAESATDTATEAE